MLTGIFALIGIAFGTLVGLPVSPFYLAAGAAWGIGAFPWVMLALLVHFALSYHLARGVMRPLIEKILKKFSTKLDLRSKNALRPRQMILLVRLLPGVPLCVKSYFLGVCAVPLLEYLFYSMLVEALWVLGFIAFGGAMMKGQWQLMATGVLLVLLMTLISKQTAKKNAGR